MSRTEIEYNGLPSYRLVLTIKICKMLAQQRPDYSDRLHNTIILIKNILIHRQLIA